MDLIRKEAEENYDEEKDIFSYWHDFASQNLFGIEINEQIARVCKMNMIIHDDGHTNIISADSLDSIEKHTKLNSQFKKENFDIILTNPPFGAKILSNEKKYLKDYELGLNNERERAAQSTEVLFIERCFQYLKEGGKMAIVLPDGILTNSTLQYVRDFIMNKFKINAIVSIPQTAFSHYGAGVKCSLLFLTKQEIINEDYDIFMAQAEYVGYDATGREIERNDLNDILKNYKGFIEKKNFKLNDNCFLVKFNSIKLNKRIDAGFNKNPFNLKSKYKIVELRDCILNEGAYGANEPSITYNKGDVRYIRISDIDENGKLKSDTLKTAKNIENKYILEDNDFLFARTGSVGRTFLYKSYMGKSIYAGYLIKYVLDNSKIYPEYLLAYCQTSKYWEWVKQHERPAVQSNINAEEYRSLPIPLPLDVAEQKYIAKIMQDAYSQKEELEKEADELLNSIDSYLLEELGIKLPEDTNTKISYTIKSSDLKGKRFDCDYHQTHYKDLENALKQGKYKLVNISEVIQDIKKGVEVGSDEYIVEKQIPFIRVSDIDNNNIDFENVDKFISDSLYENTKDRFQPKENELLYSKDGTIGICLEANYKRKYIISGAILRLQIKNQANRLFLQYLLASNIVNIFANRETIGTVIKHLNIDKFLNLKIPLPPIEIQEQIAGEITKRKQKAFDLQKEAKDILENAKKQVEKMIFNNKK